MKTISLTRGQVAIVDDEDYEYANQWRWHARRGKGKNTFYASRGMYCKDTRKMDILLMHRVILRTPDGKLTDHINGNGLDNRKENLRICSASENSSNQKLRHARPMKGVQWIERLRKWRAYISAKKQRFHLGLFTNIGDAAEAYNKAALKMHGEYASLNDLSKVKAMEEATAEYIVIHRPS